MKSSSPTCRGVLMRAVPCILMRGGTSKGPFFRTGDLPIDPFERNAVLLKLMGSGQELEIDGVGGGNPLSSKVAMVDRSAMTGVDVDYLFAQVDVLNPVVDTAPNCGNMLVAVGPFAIERGLVPATDPETVVRIRNVNTGAFVDAIVQTPGCVVTYNGNSSIDGVPGTASPIKLAFSNSAGSKTGKLFPTGFEIEAIQGVDATLIDMSVPAVIMAADAFGKTGQESAAELDGDPVFCARLESIRIEAGIRMGLPDPANSVLPKAILVSAPANGGTVTGRYFMPHSCHKAFAVTGAICLAAACLNENTVARDYVKWSTRGASRSFVIEHPLGSMTVEVEADENGNLSKAFLVRTARKLFEGTVFVP